jgi:hypothetical protein
MRVVFPAPLGPIRPTISPLWTLNETSESATTPRKRTPRFSIASVQLGAAAAGVIVSSAGAGLDPRRSIRERRPPNHFAKSSTCEHGRCELLLSLGEARAWAGNSEAAQRAFLEAADLARRAGLSRELAQAAAGYGGRIVWARAGKDVRLVPLLESGLAALSEEHVELRVRLLARLAGACAMSPPSTGVTH